MAKSQTIATGAHDAPHVELAALTLLDGARPAPPARTRPVHRRRHSLSRALLAADALACVLALLITELTLVSHFQPADVAIFALAAPALVAWTALTHVYGLNERGHMGFGHTAIDDLPDLLLLATLTTWGGILLLNATGLAHPRLRVAATFWLTFLALTLLLRTLATGIHRGRPGAREATLVVGAGRIGMQIVEKLTQRPSYGIDIVGFLDDDPLEPDAVGSRRLGSIAALEQVVRAYDVERVIVAFSRLPSEQQANLCRRCLDLGVQVDIVPRMFEVIGSRHHVHTLDGLPLLGLRPQRLSRAARLAKRALDISLSALALAFLAPLFAYCAWRIRTESPGPVFFRQERMGYGGRRFRIFKFRTMLADADARKHEVDHLNKHAGSDPRMFKIPDDPRITPFGSFLRRWSLDELPQLINVLRGEMSLVGPRPLILVEDEHVRGQRRRRLDLTPGITGLWQVLGRSDIPFAEMVTLDYLYVTNWSLWGDLKLLFRTVPVVLQRRGAY